MWLQAKCESNFLAALLEPCEQIWRLFSNFDQIMDIEKSPKPLDFWHF
jgi:hypothetical protein